MDFHISTPVETELVMKTENGRVVEVWPAPASSLPGGAVPAQPAPGSSGRPVSAIVEMS